MLTLLDSVLSSSSLIRRIALEKVIRKHTVSFCESFSPLRDIISTHTRVLPEPVSIYMFAVLVFPRQGLTVARKETKASTHGDNYVLSKGVPQHLELIFSSV